MTVLLVSLIVSAIAGWACASDGPESETELRRVVFDGETVAQQLEEEPGHRFFIDLRQDTVYEFDQRDAPIDFSAFDIQCPSMAASVDLLDWLETGAVLDAGIISFDHFELARGELGAELTHETVFRGAPPILIEPGCWAHCDPHGRDCIFCCSGGGGAAAAGPTPEA